MNIININSEIEINLTQKSFLEEVIFFEDDHHIDEDSFFCLSLNLFAIVLYNTKFEMQFYCIFLK